MRRILAMLPLFALFGSGCIIIDDDDPPATGCFSDLDCPGGYYCAAGGSCLPEVAAVPVYDPCVVVDECEALATRCQEIVAEWPDRTSRNNICTYECIDSSDCVASPNGLEGLCVQFGGTPFICYEQCVDGGDCGVGFDCATLDGGFQICVPR